MDVGVTFGQFRFSHCRPLLFCFFYITLYFTSDCRDGQSETVLSWECKVSLTLIYCETIKEQKSLSSISFCTSHVAELFPRQTFLFWKLLETGQWTLSWWRQWNIWEKRECNTEGLNFPKKTNLKSGFKMWCLNGCQRSISDKIIDN